MKTDMLRIFKMSSAFVLTVLLVAGSLATLVAGQTSSSAGQATSSAVPRLVKFSGVVKDEQGRPQGGVVGITFALYKDQSGGAPLWLETQNVQAGSDGRYTVFLGASKPDGLPVDLFMSGDARWIGVQPSGQAEQPRVLLVSTPYALKAADAETLGGLPVSAFVLAASANSNAAVTASATPDATAASAPPASTVTGSGTANFLPLWTSTSNIGNSVVFQSGSGSTAKVGIGTATPSATLDVKGGAAIEGPLSLPPISAANATKGESSQAEGFVASSYDSSTKAPLGQTFLWKAEAINNNTSNPSGTLNLLFGAGATTPTETGLKLSSKGIYTFASGQTFPGTGTITGVTTGSGSGLTGGGTTGNLKLSLTSTCTNGQVLQWNGTSWVCVNAGIGTVTSVGSGAGLTGGPITGTGTLSIANGGVTNAMLAANSVTSANIADGSLNPTKVAGTSAILGSNNFAGNQTISGSLNVGGKIVASGAFPAGSALVGNNTDTTSNVATNGVLGISAAPGGNGVYGKALATTGLAYGVIGGTASSDSGVGVYGSAPNGTSFGVEGVSNSATGTAGVFWNSANGDIIRGYNGGGFNNNIVFAVNNAGSVGIGNASPAVPLDILGQDASLRVRNSNTADLNAEVGGFMGNTYDSLEMGLFNLSATTTHGILAPQESRSLFGMDMSGHVGSLTNDYAAGPGYRNLLDDGAGNASIAGTLTAGIFSGNGVQLTGQITSYNGTPTAANGVPSIVLQYAFSSNGSGNIFTDLFTPPNDGIFRITAFQECTATSAGNTYFSLNFIWTLPTGGTSSNFFGGQNCLSLSGSAGSIVAHVKAGTAIQYNYAGMDAAFQTTILVEQLL